jgi:transcription elongation factor Elf1
MPKYTFTCPHCGSSLKKFANVNSKNIPCECGKEMDRKMPTIAGFTVTEVVDKYSNKKHFADQKEILTERKLDYYWEKLVPEMVNSGTYTIETMLEKGWVYYDEKHNLITRTKPPQKS